MSKISYKIALSAAILFSSINVKAVEPTTMILGGMAINTVADIIANALNSPATAQLTFETDRKKRILKARPTWQYLPFSAEEPEKGVYAMTAGVRMGDEQLPAEQQVRMALRVVPNPEGQGYYAFISSMNGFDCSPDGCRVGVKAGDEDWVVFDAIAFNVTGMPSLLLKDQPRILTLIKSQKRLLFNVAQGGETPTYWFINRKFNTNGIKFPE
jgi:hypothetical protein